MTRADTQTRSGISILLVDDHPALRAGLRSLFATEGGLQVESEAGSGEEAYGQYSRQRPDVVVMDLSMPGYGGVESISRIRKLDPDARIVVYTVHDSDVFLERALSAGALGYVTKSNHAGVVAEAVREAADGRSYVSGDMVSHLVRMRQLGRGSVVDVLTPREFEIFMLLAEGHSAEECGQLLHLSGKTVSNHATRIKQKLELGSLVDLAKLAARLGLVTI